MSVISEASDPLSSKALNKLWVRNRNDKWETTWKDHSEGNCVLRPNGCLFASAWWFFISHMFLAPPSLKQGNAHLRWFNISSALTWNRHFGCLYPWPVHHPQERAGGKDQTMDVIVVHQSDRSVIVALAKPYKDWRQLITCFQDRQTHIYIYIYIHIHSTQLCPGKWRFNTCFFLFNTRFQISILPMILCNYNKYNIYILQLYPFSLRLVHTRTI